MRKNQSGFGLVEAMIAALIGAIGLFALSMTVAVAAQNQKIATAKAQASEAARVAAEPLMGMQRVAATNYVAAFPRVIPVNGKNYEVSIASIRDGGDGLITVADYAVAIAPLTVTLSVPVGAGQQEINPSFTVPF